MANEEHLALLEQGVETWNQWRRENPEIRPDLSGANLIEVNLIGANLSGAILRKANLRNARLHGAILIEANFRWSKLREAHLIGANLHRADLRGAILIDAHLSQADLSEANLSNADLREAFFFEANLSRADLSGADLNWAILKRADLSGADLSRASLSGATLFEATIDRTIFGDLDLQATDLEKVWHRGPSTIGIDTIYRSGGNIPESFLQGCGVPEDFITYMASLTGKAFEFYSVFISYSTRDENFAKRLHADLQKEGVRCWFAPEDIKGGQKIHEQIDQAIRVYDKLLIVLSPDSMESEWVKTEIYNARQREDEEQRRKLFPISLVSYDMVRQWRAFDADVGKDMAREIREYYIPDFSNWKDHDSYQKAFERLLRDLQAEES